MWIQAALLVMSLGPPRFCVVFGASPDIEEMLSALKVAVTPVCISFRPQPFGVAGTATTTKPEH